MEEWARRAKQGANGFEGGPSSPEDHQHSPLVVKAVEKRKRKQDTVGSQSESAESFVFSSEEEVEQFEQKEEAAASSSHAVPAKSALEAGPEKKRGNQSRSYPWGPFFLSPIV